MRDDCVLPARSPPEIQMIRDARAGPGSIVLSPLKSGGTALRDYVRHPRHVQSGLDEIERIQLLEFPFDGRVSPCPDA
jgi:hypothetical protein